MSRRFALPLKSNEQRFDFPPIPEGWRPRPARVWHKGSKWDQTQVPVPKAAPNAPPDKRSQLSADQVSQFDGLNPCVVLHRLWSVARRYPGRRAAQLFCQVGVRLHVGQEQGTPRTSYWRSPDYRSQSHRGGSYRTAGRCARAALVAAYRFRGIERVHSLCG